jgi:hypothetical protein
MRISDLLLEAGPSSYVPASPGSPIVVPTPLTPPSTTPTPTPAPTTPGPDPKKRAERKNKVERGRRIQKGKNSLIDLIQKRRNEPAYNALGRKNALKILGGGMRIMRLIGYTDLVYGYWTDIAIVEDELKRQVAAKETTQAQADSDYNETRKQLLAVVVTTVAASSFIKYALRTAIGIRWLIRAFGLAGSLATGGLGIGFLIASEIAMTYFMNWATSDEGKKTIAEIITYPIIGDIKASDAIGSLATAPIDKVKAMINKITGDVKKEEPKPGQAGQATTPGKPEKSGEEWSAPGPGKPAAGEVPAGVTKPGTYSQYTNDPELKKALTAAGL